MLSLSVATFRLHADRIRIWVAFSHSNEVAAGKRRLFVTYRSENNVCGLIVVYTLNQLVITVPYVKI
jgi:hypothetical protein